MPINYGTRVKVLRIVAEPLKVSVEEVAADFAVDLSSASVADLTRIGRVLGKAMGLTSLSVS